VPEDAPAWRGKLLVATPPLADPNFDRTVVLLLEHGADGAIGVVLNRPSRLTLEESVPEWCHLAPAPSVVFVGGPVAPEAVIALVRVVEPGREGSHPVFADVGTIDLGLDPDEAAAGLSSLRVYAGYAGWAPGQLEGEVEAGGWFVVDPEPDDVFTPDPDTLWRRVLLRQPARIAMFAHCPSDPSVN
jgi:putative transcriptional regulator